MIVYLIALVCVLLYVVYAKLIRTYTYWDRKGVKGPKPQLVLGNMKSVLTKKDSINSITSKMYNQYPGEKFVGIYQGMTPTLVLRDPDLIKQVIIEDFTSFTDRGYPATEELITKNLFIEKGEKWKMLRTKLTPIFTTAKLKQMMPLINRCVDQYLQYVDKQLEKEGPYEIRHINLKYTLKVITSTAFGLDIDSFSEQKTKFIEITEKLMKPSTKPAIISLLQSISPEIVKNLYLKVVDDELSNYFFCLIGQTVKEREGKPKIRNDFIDLMAELKEQEKVNKRSGNGVTEWEMTYTMVAAQILVFLTAGFETSSGSMAYLMHELALNPDVQQRCYDEITSIMDKYNGELPYEALSELQYLNMAFEEALRKHPVGGALFRQLVTDSYKFPDTNLTIEKGTKLLIPVPSLQNDPKYFPDPEKFDPTRFAPENRQNIRDGTYLPFGDGPRNCIGMRFARVQSLLGAARLLHKYRMWPSERTVTRVRYDPLQPTLVSLDGLWINIARR